MKRTLRLWLCWTCYAIGHVASRCVITHWFEWPVIIYQRFMNWSATLQGDDERGPWGPELIPNEETIEAMEEAWRGGLPSYSNAAEMFKDLEDE